MLRSRDDQWKLAIFQHKLRELSPSTGLIAAAVPLLLIGTWRHFNTSHNPSSLQQEVWVEWISWLLIFLFSKFLSTKATSTAILNSTHVEHICVSRKMVWGTAALAVGSQLLSSQSTLTWALPLTTLVVSIASSSLLDRSPEEDEEDDEKGSISSLSINSVTTGTKEHIVPSTIVIINATCCVLLFQTGNMVVPLAVSFVLMRAGALYLITQLKAHADRSRDSDTNNVTDDLGFILATLSQPALAILTILLVIVQPGLHVSTLNIIGQALAQSIWWMSMIMLLCSGLQNTVANADTVAVAIEIMLSTWSPFTIPAGICALVASTTQSMLVLQPGMSVRKVVYGLIVVFAIGLWIRQDPRLATTSALIGKMKPTRGHPAENLIMLARVRFDDMLSKQSTSLEQAVKEYRRRYNRAPPLGFDKWFELARSHDFVLIDEFDTIMETFEPFYGVDPAVLKRRVSKVLEKEPRQINIYNITNGAMQRGENKHEIADKMTNPTWLEIVPYNMTIAVNTYGEPMVNVPWETIHHAITEAKQARRYKDSKFQVNFAPVLSVGGQSGWAASSQACSVHSPSRQVDCPASEYGLAAPLQFIENVTASKDVCQNCELLQQEGIFLKAETLNIAHELVPIWSPSKPSNFHDILYPAADYIDGRSDYKIEEDVSWEDKSNTFFWVGKAVGGHVDETNWEQMQRQRLVLRTQKGSMEPIQLLEERRPGNSIWQPRYSTMAELTYLFSTRITSSVQCDKVACELENSAFAPEREGPMGEAYRHKFLLDIDGNAFSSRYYRFLRSNSVTVKQTAFKEWHDDRLIPWVHYIPVSTSYRELPELARFFATTKLGNQLSGRIARESTEWHDKALRNIDIQLVWLRMLLEYGRLMNPDIILK